MRIEIKHHGKIENGRITWYNPQLYQQQITELEGREFVLTIKERHKNPTPSQNGFYRGGILPSCHNSELFSHFNTKDDIHTDFFAPTFLSYTVPVKFKNEYYEIKKVRSLTDLNDKEMSVFIERVLAFCAENGIIILDPSEYHNKYYQK